MSMTREQAIDNIMEAYLALASTDEYKFLPSNTVSDQAELALGALGVTDDELNAWGARTVQQMREENYNVGIPTAAQKEPRVPRQHTPVGGSTMLFIGGSGNATRCECGCNVFTRLENNEQGEHIFQCNACRSTYAAGDRA